MSDIITGRNPVLEALRAGHPVHKILLARNLPRHSGIAEILHLAKEQRIPVEYVPVPTIQQETGGAAHQGVLAYAAARAYQSLDDLLSISREKNEPAFYAVLDGVEDPQNLGAIVRTAEATGAHGIIVRARRAVGLTPALARASAGAIEYVPVARVANIAQAISTLQKENIWVVGIDPSGQTDYTEIDFAPPTALVIGGEGQGVSALVRQRCDTLARIPMCGKISSLNASVAAALALYEVFRQRRGKLVP
ncbi:MAG: 23S rRNA (guanosine(2251)-2'-O)-methyltransferase RlmB [Chloroflexota bacterium]